MEKKKMGINKEVLIRRIANSDRFKNYEIKNTKLTLELIREIYDELENQVVNCLSEVDETNDTDNPIVIRLFEGITLSSFYKPQKDVFLNFIKSEDNIATIKGRVGVKANVTRYIKEKITKLREDKLK